MRSFYQNQNSVKKYYNMTNLKNRIAIERQLSTLWIVVMLNMVFADIFSIMKALVDNTTIQIPGQIDFVMALAALITNIPILMIYFALTLDKKTNKKLNIIAAIITIFYIIGGGDVSPHYLICGSIEIFLLLVIIHKSYKW